MPQLNSKWRKFRPLAALLLSLTGAGTVVTAVVLTGADVATEMVDEYKAEQVQDGN